MSNLAKNTNFEIDTSGSGTFNQVTGVTSITWSGTTWAMEDTTSHDSTTPVTTTQTTVATNGKVSLVITWDGTNTQHALLRTLSTTGATRNYKMIQVNTGETAAFAGFVTSFAYDTPVNGLQKAKVDVTINGAMTLS